MMIRIQYVFVFVLCAALMTGCARSKSGQQSKLSSEQQKGTPIASIELRLADHHEWVKRLMISPTVNAVQQTAGNQGETAVLPVPLPSAVTASGVGYSLLVDNPAQLVWLQSHGYGGQVQKVDGPWKLDQPDAAHLLHSITNPPTIPTGKQ